eukprot:TRINITY_DN2630_c0_g1_i1.p1 TRINITY_DN2630_c0_g1~~TRINITY_DN2630_c0_g1_i1.p1  ORF type:complete len:230 (+),score=50.05 TRINITY_DN2630_c0_g1_i1:80-769(+)
MQFASTTATFTKGRRSRNTLGAMIILAGGALVLSPTFVPSPTPTEIQSRRSLLSGAMFGTLAAAPAANAAPFLFGLMDVPGPFELDPKKGVIVGDPKSEKILKAQKLVQGLIAEAKGMKESLANDDQYDVMPKIQALGIAEFRLATNDINNIMDEKTAPAIQRWQRLLIQAKYNFEDEAPFPKTRDGKVKPRGPERLKRMNKLLDQIIFDGEEMLKFLPAATPAAAPAA